MKIKFLDHKPLNSGESQPIFNINAGNQTNITAVIQERVELVIPGKRFHW
jgi:hypothetical protein